MVAKLRILQCKVCKTLEVLPDYQGDPNDDVLLANLASRHVFPSGDPHKGQLFDVEKRHWESPSTRQAIINQIRESSGHTGFDTAYYDAKETFKEDAMVCWVRDHNRTKNCGDYRTEKKRIYPDTKAERKDLGLSIKAGPKSYLCDFCPFDGLVKSAARYAALD